VLSHSECGAILFIGIYSSFRLEISVFEIEDGNDKGIQKIDKYLQKQHEAAIQNLSEYFLKSYIFWDITPPAFALDFAWLILQP
jgi:hypothetical protein